MGGYGGGALLNRACVVLDGCSRASSPKCSRVPPDVRGLDSTGDRILCVECPESNTARRQCVFRGNAVAWDCFPIKSPSQAFTLRREANLCCRIDDGLSVALESVENP